MKKILAIAIAVAGFVVPTFAESISVGKKISYSPLETSSSAYVTKIAPAVKSGYELQLSSDGIVFTYIVNNGDEISLFDKSQKKQLTFKISSLDNNVAELTEKTTKSSSPKQSKTIVIDEK